MRIATKFACLIMGCWICTLNAQEPLSLNWPVIESRITFSEIVEAAKNPNLNEFQRHLKSNGLSPNKIEKTFESWGFNLESGKAHYWVHIRKTENHLINEIQFISWGHNIHAQLVEGIVKECKYHGASRHYEGTYYHSYLYEDLLEINIWNGNKDGIDYFIIDIYFSMV